MNTNRMNTNTNINRMNTNRMNTNTRGVGSLRTNPPQKDGASHSVGMGIGVLRTPVGSPPPTVEIGVYPTDTPQPWFSCSTDYTTFQTLYKSYNLYSS